MKLLMVIDVEGVEGEHVDPKVVAKACLHADLGKHRGGPIGLKWAEWLPPPSAEVVAMGTKRILNA